MRVCLGHLFFFLENLRYEARVDHIIVKFLNESLTKNSSVGKESPCNIGNPGSIPGSGRSTGEGLSYPLQYPWASLVTQLVKNLPAMQETWVRFLGWEDSLKNGGCPLQYSVLEKSMDYSPWGHKESDMTEQLSLSEKCISKMHYNIADIKYDEYGRENESSHRSCLENQADSEILVKIEN